MFLKKLEIIGFKSFADRIEFAFEPGLTGLVGPNGCGKSNIVDAIRWGLGEQSPKSLRGKEMTDVIFNGSESRPPSGFAEVSLTFDNEGGQLPTEYTEVVITRRLYRSGDSEYLINNNPARLRDIRELFMDTGMGMQAYSVIEQGRIDLLLQANALERRVVFEEAAGISKYKARREEAERKLEHVEANLVRLRDIIEEVQKQVRSLQRQAGKARRYKEYAEQLKDMRISLAARHYTDTRAQEAEACRKEQQLQDGIGALNAQIDTLGAEVARQETQLLEMDERLAAERENLARAHQDMSTAEQKIGYHTQRTRETNDTQARLNERSALTSASLKEIRIQCEASRLELEKIAGGLAQRESLCAGLEAVVKDAASARAALESELNERKAEVIDTLQEISLARNELTALGERGASVRARSERLAARREKASEDLRRVRATGEALRSQAAEAEIELGTCKAGIARAVESVEEERKKLRAIDAEFITARGEQSSKRSQFQLLATQEAGMEGLREGVKAVLKAREEGGLSGIGGMVGTVLQADLPNAAAIDAALGDKAQAIITSGTENALNAVKFLKEKRGRAAFLSHDRIALQRRPAGTVPAGDGVVGRAVDLVRCEESYRPIAEFLLGDVLVVRDIETAMRLVMDGGREFRIVTLDGDTVEQSGLITGGVSEPGGIVSRRSQMRILEEDIAQAERRLAGLQNEREARLAALKELDSQQASLRARMDSATVARAESAKEASQLEAQAAELQQELALIESDLAEIEREAGAITARTREVKGGLAALEEKHKAAKARVAELEGNMHRAMDEFARRNEELTSARVMRAQLAERRNSVAALHSRQEEEAKAAEAEIEKIQGEIVESVARVAESEKIISESRNALAQLMKDVEIFEGRISEAEGARSVLRESLETHRARLREHNSQRRAEEEALQSVRLLLNEHRLRAEGMIEKIRDEYNVNLLERLSAFEGADIDYELLPSQIEELREKIEKMGSVNLQAIEELEEAEKRSEFLAGQEHDLVSAKDKLQEVIRKINRESRERFEATFNAVREHFQVLFRQLFGGGKADIQLEEGVDILEAGVEIIARPPGKQMRNITLLSGGEKVLTAIALVFALFRARPSPFAILDEVDAALDDTNIGRFLVLLQEFLKRSQFVIISHNKQTMAAADVLYGVTMQEHGVSKKVAVRFEDIETRVA